MTPKRLPYYVTTAIPYVNSTPHVGFALELVLADAIARHSRQRGRDVRFLNGTDDNSLKNVRAAEAAGISTHALVERNAEHFRALKDALAISLDDFIQTHSDPRHAPGVSKLWRACEQNRDIYRRSYSGLYCVGCEQFYSDAELDDGRCPDHGTAPELGAEENYFFRLSRYQRVILDLLESGRITVEPEPYRNELLAFVRAGLEDFSISRTAERAGNWGIPVPGDSSQVTYVWFDALGNYVTALGYAQPGQAWQRYWQGSGQRVHVVGKGITRFHAIYWPAILLSAGLALPDRILVHGYLTANGHKISKSLAAGGDTDPAALARRFGADALRYYLLRHTRPYQDTDFTVRRLRALYRSELAGQLGNLVSRVLGLVHLKCDGLVPACAKTPPEPLASSVNALPQCIDVAVESFRVNDALDAIWQLTSAANRYVEHAAPWKLCGSARDEVIGNACEVLRILSASLVPFLPQSAAKIAAALCSQEAGPRSWTGLRPGTRVGEVPILFPHLSEAD